MTLHRPPHPVDYEPHDDSEPMTRLARRQPRSRLWSLLWLWLALGALLGVAGLLDTSIRNYLEVTARSAATEIMR
jgi:hypothetical protein